MNKTEVIIKVSEKSGIDFTECEEVLNAFEEVLTEELNNSKGKASIFDKVYKIMNFLNSKRTNK